MLGQPQSMMTGTGLIEQRYGMTSIPDAQASCRRRKVQNDVLMMADFCVALHSSTFFCLQPP